MATKTAKKIAELPLTKAPVAPEDNLPATQQPGGAVVTATADPIFAIIERLSKDPAFDVDKMERLINMHERAKAGNARADFDQAMSLAQQAMMAIRTNAKSDKGKYANYAALDKVIRPVYTQHGFSVSFDTDPGAPAETVRLVATVAHSGGHRERRQLDIPADGKGARGGDVMTKTHATASAITYGKRYLSSMIWNLAIDYDDDGNAAASTAERAKTMADNGIERLNTSNFDRVGLEKWNTDNAKSIAWLKKNAPEQFDRYQTAYTNAAERAGISKVEPKRNDKKQDPSPSGASPHSDSAGDGRPEGKADQKAASSGAPADKSKVTDVVDENEAPPADGDDTPINAEPITFDMFTTARAFFDFSDDWLQDPKRTPAEAALWEEFYRTKLKEMAEHKFDRIREAVATTIGYYSAVLAKKQPE